MEIDIDRQQCVKDHYGHSAGDAALIEVARRLKRNLRAIDLIAQTGGEEFLIIIPDTRLREAEIAGQRLCYLINQGPIELPNVAAGVTFSISMGNALRGTSTVIRKLKAQLLNHPGQALHGSEARSRNRVTFVNHTAKKSAYFLSLS